MAYILDQVPWTYKNKLKRMKTLIIVAVPLMILAAGCGIGDEVAAPATDEECQQKAKVVASTRDDSFNVHSGTFHRHSIIEYAEARTPIDGSGLGDSKFCWIRLRTEQDHRDQRYVRPNDPWGTYYAEGILCFSDDNWVFIRVGNNLMDDAWNITDGVNRCVATLNLKPDKPVFSEQYESVI